MDGSDISTALYPAGLSPDVSSVDTHTVMHHPARHRGPDSWNAYSPTLDHADAGACAAIRLGPGRPCSQHDSSTICPGPVGQRRRRHALHTRRDPVELLHCSEVGVVRQLYTVTSNVPPVAFYTSLYTWLRFLPSLITSLFQGPIGVERSKAGYLRVRKASSNRQGSAFTYQIYKSEVNLEVKVNIKHFYIYFYILLLIADFLVQFLLVSDPPGGPAPWALSLKGRVVSMV